MKNMYKKIIVVLFAVICLVTVGCKKDPDPVDPDGELIRWKIEGEYYDIYIGDELIDRFYFDAWTIVTPVTFALGYSGDKAVYFAAEPYTSLDYGPLFVAYYYNEQSGYEQNQLYFDIDNNVAVKTQGDKLVFSVDAIDYRLEFDYIYEENEVPVFSVYVSHIEKTGISTFCTDIYVNYNKKLYADVRIDWTVNSKGEIIPVKAEFLKNY